MNKEDCLAIIPPATIGALNRYVERRIPTGDFLYAVLTNNLFEAYSRADQSNTNAMKEIVIYIYNYIPAICWGSVEKVNNWLNHKE